MVVNSREPSEHASCQGVRARELRRSAVQGEIARHSHGASDGHCPSLSADRDAPAGPARELLGPGKRQARPTRCQRRGRCPFAIG